MGRSEAPILSERGEPVKVLPGLTPEQSKLFQDLHDRIGPVTNAYNQTLPEKDFLAYGTRSPMPNERPYADEKTILDGMAKSLSVSEGKLLDAQAGRSDYTPQEIYQVVAKQAQWLDDLQARENITNDGVRKLPLMTIDESKQYAERTARAREGVSRFEDVVHGSEPIPMDTAAKQNGQQAVQDYETLLKMPRNLGYINSMDSFPDAQKRELADRQTKPMSEMDQRMDTMDRDLHTYGAAVEESKGLVAEQQQADRAGRGFVNRARGFANRAYEAVDNVARRAADRIRDAVGRTPSSDRASSPALGDETKTPSVAAPAAHAAPQAPDTPAQDEAKSGPAQPAWQQGTARTDSARHMTVEIGEGGHDSKRGLGFMAMGNVDDVKHHDGVTEIDYTVHGHHMEIKMDDKQGPGGHNPLSDAADSLRPGDAFKFAISRDAKGGELAQVEDRTTGHATVVHDTGRVEEKNQAPGVQRDNKSVGR